MKLSQPQIKVLASRLAKQINEKIDEKNLAELETLWEKQRGPYEIAVMKYNKAIADLYELRRQVAPSYELLEGIFAVTSYSDSPVTGHKLDSDLHTNLNIHMINESKTKEYFFRKQVKPFTHVTSADLVEDIIYRTIEYQDLDLLCESVLRHYMP